MILFSRSFIRRRAISLATTASVAATSFALAQDPMKAHQVRAAMPDAAMMVPHRQGAVDIAKAELEYGRNERLRRLAQEMSH
jgi:uncharacterized protein (DUF305 family)